MTMHHSITLERVAEAAGRQQFSLDDPGFCLACGHEQDGCEPDAVEIECEACGECQVHGASDLVIRMI